MDLVHGPTETEVKIRIADRSATITHLRALGFAESAPRLFEANTLYDTPDRNLQARQTLLRLRQVGDRTVITWKGPATAGPHKSRPERETTVGSFEVLHAILSEIGFQPTFRYEKFRAEFQRSSDEGVVTVDETPIGLYLELEGSGDWIDRTAQQLGFSETDYILDSYGKLYLAYCDEQNVRPGNMTFPAGETGV